LGEFGAHGLGGLGGFELTRGFGGGGGGGGWGVSGVGGFGGLAGLELQAEARGCFLRARGGIGELGGVGRGTGALRGPPKAPETQHQPPKTLGANPPHPTKRRARGPDLRQRGRAEGRGDHRGAVQRGAAAVWAAGLARGGGLVGGWGWVSGRRGVCFGVGVGPRRPLHPLGAPAASHWGHVSSSERARRARRPSKAAVYVPTIHPNRQTRHPPPPHTHNR
jgi:hypothetical protein